MRATLSRKGSVHTSKKLSYVLYERDWREVEAAKKGAHCARPPLRAMSLTTKTLRLLKSVHRLLLDAQYADS
eukprot:3324927-Amphidinium_carterae.2